MMKSALAMVCLACVGYGRRIQVQLDTEATAAFNPSSAGTRVSVKNPGLAGLRPQVLNGRVADPMLKQDRAEQAKMSTVAEPQLQQDEVKPPKNKEDLFGKPLVVGLSHHTASVEVREKLSVPENQWNEVSAKLVEFDSIDEAAIISTCNRFEIYVVTKDKSAAERDLLSFLSKRADLPEEDLEPNLFEHWNEDASWHILRVAGGLDSLVVGEAHILAQLKAMSRHAMAPASKDEPAGSAKEVLGRLLTSAISSGKAVRTETTLGDGAVSISSAGVELALMKSPLDLRRPLVDLQVAVVGAGTMGRSFMMNLDRMGLSKLTLLNRSPERAETLAAEFPGMKTDIKLMDEFWPTIEKCDLVLTATSSVDPIITKDELIEHIPKDRKLMLIDISVPRNIAADCDELPNVFSYNVDDLKQVVAANQAKRQEAVLEAEVILKKELLRFQKWQSTVHYLPLMKAISKKSEAFVDAELEEAKKKGIFDDLDDQQMKFARKALHEPVDNFGQWPMIYLNKGDPDGTKAKVSQLKRLFGLTTPQMIEADSEELQLYAPLWENLSNRLEKQRLEIFNGKKARLSSAFPKVDVIEEMTQRINEQVLKDTKTYFLSHIEDSDKLSVEEIKQIFGIRD